MILKSVHLKNFRQFIDEKIEFSLDKEKNITLVRGDNSAGKTTLANAITWCLFAKTGLEGTLINRLVWQQAPSNAPLTVSVEIVLLHAGDEYTITATQDFEIIQGILANSKSRVQAATGVNRKISYKGPSTTWIKEEVPKEKIENTIQKIVPQELSEYFFIKAEQMQTFEQSVTKGDGKSFEKAVKRILGFEAVENAVKHTGEAIRELNASLKHGTDEKAEKLQKNITWYDEQITKLTNNITQYEKDIADHEAEIADLSKRIKEGAGAENDALALERAKTDFNSYTRYLKNDEIKLFNSFSENFVENCYQEFLPTILEKLRNEDLSDRDIPDASAATIAWILNRKECICGRKFEENDEIWKIIHEWTESLPPENVGNCAKRFIETIEDKQSRVFNLKKQYDDFLSNKEEWERKKDDAKQIIQTLSAKLKSYQSTKEYQIRLENAERDKQAKETEIRRFKRKISEELEPNKLKDKKELNKLALDNERNQLIRKRGSALTVIYKHFKHFNDTQKIELNKILSNKVNEFFSTVFTNDYKISISDKYAIKLVDNDGEIVGAGGAQSVSVVLAFITSLLKLSQQIHYGKLEEIEDKDLLKAEPYPLVLDAPFSAFAEERIKVVAPKLSDLSEQVIIFTKDPECKIVESCVMDKVGKYYKFAHPTREDGKEEVWSTIIEGGGDAI